MDNKLEVEDLLRLKLYNEKAARINSELTNIELHKQRLQSEATKFQVEQQAFSNTLREKYSLSQEDQVSIDDGVITRKQTETKKD